MEPQPPGVYLARRGGGKDLPFRGVPCIRAGRRTHKQAVQLEKGSLRTILSKAIWAAYQKSLLLGEQNSITSPERELPLNES